MYIPGIIFERTPEERRDIFLSWQRDDKVFFASGACHILAHIAKGSHKLRPPEYFPYLPWERAYNYIKNFSA